MVGHILLAWLILVPEQGRVVRRVLVCRLGEVRSYRARPAEAHLEVRLEVRPHRDHPASAAASAAAFVPASGFSVLSFF